MQYKSILTVTWDFESHNDDTALNEARAQVQQLLNKPNEFQIENFCKYIQVMRTRKKKSLIFLASFPLDDVLPYATEDKIRRDYQVGDKIYPVKMNSERYRLFRKSAKCHYCGLEGTRLHLDFCTLTQTAHFNLYGEENGQLILMTKDHIIPRSKGGGDYLRNYVTSCRTCNMIKCNYDLTKEQINELRSIWNNNLMLPKKALTILVRKTRNQMINKV